MNCATRILPLRALPLPLRPARLMGTAASSSGRFASKYPLVGDGEFVPVDKKYFLENADNREGIVTRALVNDRTIHVDLAKVYRNDKVGVELEKRITKHVDDIDHQARTGDRVLIRPSRRISATKSFQLVQILRRYKEK